MCMIYIKQSFMCVFYAIKPIYVNKINQFKNLLTYLYYLQVLIIDSEQ